MSAVSNDKIVNFCKSVIESANATIDKWQANVGVDPENALMQVALVFAAVANTKVFSNILARCERSEAMEILRDRATRELVLLASDTNLSTSEARNMMRRYEAAAWAKFIEELRWLRNMTALEARAAYYAEADRHKNTAFGSCDDKLASYKKMIDALKAWRDALQYELLLRELQK